jgi:hypothetical protein
MACLGAVCLCTVHNPEANAVESGLKQPELMALVPPLEEGRDQTRAGILRTGGEVLHTRT